MADPVLLSAAALFGVVLLLAVALWQGVQLAGLRGALAAAPAEVAAGVRGETERLRQAFDEGARALREETGAQQARFQDGVLNAFRALGEGTSGRLREFGERLDAGLAAVDARAGGIAQKLDADMTAMAESAERNREALRRLVEAKLDEQATRQTHAGTLLREELGNGFQRFKTDVGSSVSVLGEQQKERLEKLEAALAALTTKQEAAQAELRRTVEDRLDHLRKENEAKLEQMRATVDEKLQSTLETRLGESFNRVVEQLAEMQKGVGEMRHLAANVGDLKNVLTNVKVRGSYGEVTLAALLEDMLAAHQFEANFAPQPSSGERVEFAVRMPGGDVDGAVFLPIDAKFPRDDYERLLAAFDGGDEAAIAECRRGLVRAIRKCAKDIGDKYVHPPRTTDFGLMFLPTESLYAEVLREPGLFDALKREHRVVVAGPTTLTAILGGLKMGFQSLAIQKRSSEVWKVLGAVKTEFAKYNGVVAKIEKQLGTATNSVGELGTRTRAIERSLRTVDQVEGTAILEPTLALVSAVEEDDRPAIVAAE
jgi:DNA recombination protein RmuC